MSKARAPASRGGEGRRVSETPCEGGRATGSPGTRPVFDAHFHIIDPRFPLIPDQGYLPEPFTARDYLERTSTLNVTGGAIVSGAFAELYIDSKDLPELEGRLAALPKLAIKHLGMTRDGYAALLRLVEKGTKVKATGFGRVRLDVATALREISVVDPGALVFGTDLPGTRARRPFEHADIDLIFETLGEQTARRVLYSNAEELYSVEKEKDKRRG